MTPFAAARRFESRDFPLVLRDEVFWMPFMSVVRVGCRESEGVTGGMVITLGMRESIASCVATGIAVSTGRSV